MIQGYFLSGSQCYFLESKDIIGDRFVYRLINREKKRAESYAAWAKETIARGEWELIRKSLQRGRLTGSPRFVDEIGEKIERRVENKSVPFFLAASFAVGWSGWLGLCYPAVHGDHRSRVRKRRTSSYAPTAAATG